VLTLDLVRTRLLGDQVVPRWLVKPGDEPAPELVARADAIVALFRDHHGRARGELEIALKDHLRSSDDPRLERGLAKLLLDRSDFETCAPIDPALARRTTFSLAARARAEGRFDRARVLADAATALATPELSPTPEQVDQALWSDLKAMERLEVTPDLNGRDLIHRYDVALAQAVLLRAESVRVEAELDPPAARRLVRVLKFFRLLFRAQPTPRGLVLELDGPLSLFGPVTRYGLRLAEALPTILLTPFALEAVVRWRRPRKRFVLTSAQHLRSPARDRGAWSPPEVEALERRFRETVTDWEVDARGAPLLDLGGEDVLVPDLRFVHKASGCEAYLEVLGHWRRRSLEKRLALLRKHAPTSVVVAVGRGLAADEASLERDLPVEVVLYRELPSVKEVLARLERVRTGKRRARARQV
jgi:predicted nuclease of restriction endonuclease-like RecB superfamily